MRVFASSISSRSDNHERSDGFEAKVLIDGEEQQLRELKGRPRDPAPFPAYAQPDEFSRLRIPRPGREGFRDPVGQGRRLRSRPQGDWERTLRASPGHDPVRVTMGH